MKKNFFIAVAVLCSSQLFAQENAKNLNEIVVTATKIPIKQSLTGKVLTVITKEQLEKNSGKSLSEILNTQTGIIVNGASNTLGTNQDVYMRGASAGKTLILIDGIPAYDVTSISSSFDLNLIAVDQIERIEILKGSQSTLYGSDAVAGVINIILKKGSKKLINVDANLSWGTYNTNKASFGINGKLFKTQYCIQFSKINSAGFSAAYDSTGNKNFDKDGFNESVFRANFSHQANKNLLLRFTTQLSKYSADLDAAAFIDKTKYTVNSNNSIIGVGADYNLGKNKLHFNYNYNQTQRVYLEDTTYTSGSLNYSHNEYNGKAHFIEAYSNFFVTKNVDVLIGTDYRVQILNQNYLGISSYGTYSSALGDSAKANQLGVYASLLVKNINGFNAELGGRYNYFNKYGNVFTFSFNPSYRLNNNVKIFANISSGFKAPTLYEIYSEYRNSLLLKPEKSITYETGFQYTKKNYNLRAVYFVRQVTNLISFYNISTPPYGMYVNADEQKDNGIEVDGSIKIKKWNINANYTNLNGFIKSKNGTSDTAYFNLYRRPKQSLNFNVAYNITKRWSANIALQSIGKRLEFIYGAAPIEIAAYYTINLFSSINITNKLKFYVDLKNITNQQYFEIYGYSSKKFNSMVGVLIKL